MAIIEKGRVCIVTKGADAGKEVVIKDVVDKNFVIIVGEKTKERKSNIRHLEPTNKAVKEIPAGKQVKQKEKKPQMPEKKEEPKKKK